jgi:hypothetical protein
VPATEVHQGRRPAGHSVTPPVAATPRWPSAWHAERQPQRSTGGPAGRATRQRATPCRPQGDVVPATDSVLAAPGCLTLRDWCWVCGLERVAGNGDEDWREERGAYVACGEQSGKEVSCCSHEPHPAQEGRPHAVHESTQAYVGFLRNILSMSYRTHIAITEVSLMCQRPLLTCL